MSLPLFPPVQLLIVDDDAPMRETLTKRFLRLGVPVESAVHGAEALAKVAQRSFDVAVLDLFMPGMNGIELLERLKALQPDLEVLLLTAHASIETAIRAMKRGAYDYLLKPVHLADLEVHIRKAHEKVQLVRRERQWTHQAVAGKQQVRLVGSSQAMCDVRAWIEQVGPLPSPALVCGEPGAGKTTVARALHFHSKRHARPFVTCAPPTDKRASLETACFGDSHRAQPAFLELADGGTLFVPEVADLTAQMQAKLVRFIETGRYRRAGSAADTHADVRLVVGAAKSLEQEVYDGRFRADLLERLRFATIHLPPLRERRDDIPALVEHFLATRPIGSYRCRITSEALAALVNYSWPGNVRELANVLERAQMLARAPSIDVADLPSGISHAAHCPAQPHSRLLREAERRHILEVLHQENGNKASAAKALGISRRALYRFLERFKND